MSRGDKVPVVGLDGVLCDSSVGEYPMGGGGCAGHWQIDQRGSCPIGLVSNRIGLPVISQGGLLSTLVNWRTQSLRRG